MIDVYEARGRVEIAPHWDRTRWTITDRWEYGYALWDGGPLVFGYFVRAFA